MSHFDGVDDQITSAAFTVAGDLFSTAAWFNAETLGGGNGGVVFTHGITLPGTRLLLGWNGSGTATLRITADFASNSAYWDMTTAFASLTGWKWAMVTYDRSSVATDPILYVLDGNTWSVWTVGSGLTEMVAPIGVAAPAAVVFQAGYMATYDLAWQGTIGEVGVWSGKILTAAEAQAVAHLGVFAVPTNLALYWPLDGGQTQDLSGNGRAGTVTGALAGENPPIRPAGRRG